MKHWFGVFHLFSILAILGLIVRASAVGAIPVFSGAEGFGVHTTAGRGGKIYRVINLQDAGPGTLRRCIKGKEPRTCVFEIAGTIEVGGRELYIDDPYITIAGQTAPEPGITIINAGIRIRTHDVLIQHIRLRVGDKTIGPDPEGRDGILVVSDKTRKNRPVYNVVIDHCSVSWAVDENIDLWGRDLHDVTVSNSIISEALDDSLHPKGRHSMGLLVGQGVKRVSIIRNLFAHNNRRNPRIKGGASAIVVNNVIYNPGQRAISLTDAEDNGPITAGITGNVLISGNDTGLNAIVHSRDLKNGSRIYIARNACLRIWRNPLFCSRGRVPTRFRKPATDVVWPKEFSVLDENLVVESVLDNAGARPWDRDAVDRRIIEDVRGGTGRLIDSMSDVDG